MSIGIPSSFEKKDSTPNARRSVTSERLMEFAETRNMIAAVLMNSTSSSFEKSDDCCASIDGCLSTFMTCGHEPHTIMAHRTMHVRVILRERTQRSTSLCD
eukprot:SAG11_NODE_8287_length_1034_cov_0.875936_2_plen_101_part_00